MLEILNLTVAGRMTIIFLMLSITTLITYFRALLNNIISNYNKNTIFYDAIVIYILSLIVSNDTMISSLLTFTTFYIYYLICYELFHNVINKLDSLYIGESFKIQKFIIDITKNKHKTETKYVYFMSKVLIFALFLTLII